VKSKINRLLRLEEDIKYSFQNILLIFFSFSVIGWIWEVIYRLIRKGVFVNRGFLFGPWIPVYGLGSMLIILISKKLRKRPVLYALVSAFSFAVLEYAISMILEYVFHMKYWTYERYFMNLNGRICLESVLGFTIAGFIACYFLLPFLNKLYNKIKPKLKLIICIILSVLYIIDFSHSLINPNTGKGISWQVNK